MFTKIGKKKLYKFITGEEFAERCDYSLGDQAGLHNKFPNHHFEEANFENQKLISYLTEISSLSQSERTVSIFIDHIRLAGLMPRAYKESDREFLQLLTQKNNLFQVIESFPDIKFIVFCALEDSGLDERIAKLIPGNVLGICSTIAHTTSTKVHALPNGIQRTVDLTNKYHNYMHKLFKKRKLDFIRSTKRNFRIGPLLFVSFNISTNLQRGDIRTHFAQMKWAKVYKRRLSRRRFLRKLRRYPFVLCPQGNSPGDTHREWESLYAGSVPILERTPYLEKIHEGHPVLFVNSFFELTKELLISNLHLLEQLRNFEVSKWNADYVFSVNMMKCLENKDGYM